MYDAILIAAGYTKHSTRFQSECWIKEGKPDINVSISGDYLWSDELFSYGYTEKSMKLYFQRTA